MDWLNATLQETVDVTSKFPSGLWLTLCPELDSYGRASVNPGPNKMLERPKKSRNSCVRSPLVSKHSCGIHFISWTTPIITYHITTSMQSYHQHVELLNYIRYFKIWWFIIVFPMKLPAVGVGGWSLSSSKLLRCRAVARVHAPYRAKVTHGRAQGHRTEDVDVLVTRGAVEFPTLPPDKLT